MVIDKLKKILSDQLSADIAQISENTEFVDDLGADSLDIAELLMGVETEFGLLLTEDMTKDVKNVGQLAALIEQLSE